MKGQEPTSQGIVSLNCLECASSQRSVLSETGSRVSKIVEMKCSHGGRIDVLSFPLSITVTLANHGHLKIWYVEEGGWL